jgi:tetratricopeptide (TPR) repeat protein
MTSSSSNRKQEFEGVRNFIMITSFITGKNHVQRGRSRHPFSLVLISILIFALQQTAWGLEEANNSGLDHLRANKKIQEGIELLYNLEFDEAENLFQGLIAESPDRPAGYFYLAMVSWSRMVAGFWSPETVTEYKERIDRTVQVAQGRIENKIGDSDDYFYLGGALGFLARFEMMKGQWFSSFRVAKKAIKALKTCSKMDPDNYDVLLGLGTFDYYTTRLSTVLRFLSYFLLHKGNKQKGLEKLHLAAEKAIYSGTEAKSLLLHIYLFLEDDCSKAIPLARELGETYAPDPSYKLFEGFACIRLGLWDEYSDVLSYMHQRSLQASSSMTALSWKRRSLYLESIHDLFLGHYPEARSKLMEIMGHSDPEKDPAMIAWPMVKIGMAYDLEGNRNEAKKYYHQVLGMENGSGAQFMAEKCLEDPPVERDPIIGY